MLSSVQNRSAMGSLIFARIIYAVNWLNVGAIFYLMSPDVGGGVSGLGTVNAVFYVGIGLMQIPGGVLAAKWGPKKVVVIGIFLTSFSVIGTSLASTIPEIAALRLLAGAGMALVFAPGVVIVANLIRGGKSGVGVGLFNSAFDVGGLAGLFGWVVIAMFVGWRPSLAMSGALGVVTGVLVALFVPSDRSEVEFAVRAKTLWSLLKDRQLILLGLGTLGFSVANTIISGFMVFYLADSLGFSGEVAGLVASLVTVVPIFTALWGGRFYDSLTRHRPMMLLALLGSAAALALGALPSIYAAAASSALGGVVSGIGYTFAFAGARDLNRTAPEYDTLAIAWVNSISLTGSFLPPVFFSYVVELQGYPQAWMWSAALTLVFLIPIFLMVEEWRR